MIIAKVVGTAVASVKLDALKASKLLVVRPRMRRATPPAAPSWPWTWSARATASW